MSSLVRCCCDAYLFYQVKRQDLQGKQLLATNEKYYIADHGIREAVYGGNMRDINLILENIVFLELLRRGYEVTVGKAGEREVDFVCGKRGEKLYVQVIYLLASQETIEREFGVYDEIRDNFPKYVVSLDEFDMSRNMGSDIGIFVIFCWMKSGNRGERSCHLEVFQAGSSFLYVCFDYRSIVRITFKICFAASCSSPRVSGYGTSPSFLSSAFKISSISPWLPGMVRSLPALTQPDA